MTNRLIVQESGGRVAVGLQFSGQLPEPAGAPADLDCRFGDAEREDLRWYLEEYLIAPFAAYETRGQTIQGRLDDWGRMLFDALFGPGKPGRDAYLRAGAGAELVLTSASPSVLSLPWELLRDPQRATPLALDLAALDRTLNVQAPAAAPVPKAKELRVLMVIARPGGHGDVGYQMIARPLLKLLEAVGGTVQLDVLCPPTLDALK